MCEREESLWRSWLRICIVQCILFRVISTSCRARSVLERTLVYAASSDWVRRIPFAEINANKFENWIQVKMNNRFRRILYLLYFLWSMNKSKRFPRKRETSAIWIFNALLAAHKLTISSKNKCSLASDEFHFFFDIWHVACADLEFNRVLREINSHFFCSNAE